MDITVSPNLNLNSDEMLSADNPGSKDYLVVAIDVVLIVIIIASIAGNLLVCMAIGWDPILRTPSNVFIASLAIADLLVAVLVMPFSLSTNIVHQSIYSPVFCKAWISFDVTFCSISVIHLCMISIDRYYHIKEPFKYKRKMTSKAAVIISITVWMFKALSAFVPVCSGLFKAERNPPIEDILNVTVIEYDGIGNFSGWHLSGFHFCDHAFNSTYSIITAFVDFLIPSWILIFVYAQIFHLIQTRAKNLRHGRLSCVTSGDDNVTAQTDFRVNTQHHSHHHKAAIMIGAIIGLYLICWTPFFINLLVCSFQDCISFSSKTDEVLTWVGYLNSCMNPCVYAISNPEFRKSFKDLVHHKPKSWMLSRTRSLSLRYRRNAQSNTTESTC